MSGFSAQSNRFLMNLAKNNNKPWFTEHKAVYELHIKDAAQVYAAQMCQTLERLTGIEHQPKIFRIYRDVRFGKDKTPYHTHQRISFIPQSKLATPPTWFFSLEQDCLVLGVGVFAYQKGELLAWRERVAGKDGIELAELLSKFQKQGLRLSEPELKRTPAGYARDTAQADLLRRKGLAAWLDYESAEPAYGSAAACARGFRKLKPLFDWFGC